MNTSNPNINPLTDLMAVVPGALPPASANNPAADAVNQASADQNLRNPQQQLDALQELRESITAQNQSASEIQPEQCPVPNPDNPIEKGQLESATPLLIQPLQTQPIQPIQPIQTQPIQPTPNPAQPTRPIQSPQPTTEQPVPPVVQPAAPASVSPTNESTPSDTVQPTAALDSFAEQQKDLQQLQVLRLKAARRQREAHELSQEYTKEQLAQLDPAQLAQLAKKKAADKARATAQKTATEKAAQANAVQEQANQTTPPAVDGAPNQQLGQQHAAQPYVPQDLRPVDQHAAMMQSAMASNVHPHHPVQQGHPQAAQYQQQPPYPYPQMPPGAYPPMGYPPQVAPQHPLAGAPNPNAPPMQQRPLAPKVDSDDVEEFFESQYAAKHLEERDHSFMKLDVQFRNCLMNNLREGIIYIDTATRVTSWNRSAEELTGITSTSVKGFELTPSRLGLVGADGNRVDDNNCPMKVAMETGDTSEQKFVIRGRSGRESKIEMTIVPVKDEGQVLGAVIIINDYSIQVELERQVKDLHLLSVRDPLTQVANRAEFERLLEEYVRMHRATKTHCCIIVCDIDFFKQVNDTYGHHIGDQALISFACMLQKYVRARDVVARYGGEEFVILCANCNIDSAVGRAEEIRMALNKTPQQMLNGKTMSASFGVSQLLGEESTTDFFVRADQALYKAKESGRNQVVRASTDAQDGEAENAEFGSAREMSKVSGLTWRTLKSKVLFCEEFVSRTPQAMLVQKMRGFIDEKQAQILRCDADCVSMVVRVSDASRSQDFRMDIELQTSPDPAAPETHMRVVVFPPQRRLFRGTNDDLYHRLVLDIRQYLMINDEGSHMHLNTFADPTKAR